MNTNLSDSTSHCSKIACEKSYFNVNQMEYSRKIQRCEIIKVYFRVTAIIMDTSNSIVLSTKLIMSLKVRHIC